MFKFAPASRKSDPCKLRGTLVNPVEFAIIHTRYVSLPYVRDPPLHSWAEGSEAWYTDRMQNIYVRYVTQSVFPFNTSVHLCPQYLRMYLMDKKTECISNVLQVTFFHSTF